MSKSNKLEMFLTLNSEAFKKGIRDAGSTLKGASGVMGTALGETKKRFQDNIQTARAYNDEIRKSGTFIDTLRGKVVALVGAYAGIQSLIGIKDIITESSSATFALESSLMAANREFDNVGSAESWARTIDLLSERLRIYAKSELKQAAAATIDMTKRLGLSEEQMAEVIARTADLSAGKTDLAGGVERVTAALRGEAEASEYLGLTLNENYVKAWHEAHNAHGIAWKDLSDLEKAQVRYNVFLEQAIPLNGKAANSVSTLSGAYALVKKVINDAVSENEAAVEVTKELAEFLSENAAEIGELAVMLTTAAAETIKFVVANKEAVTTVGLLVLGIGALATGISAVTTVWQGLNAVMLLLTGVGVVPWLASIVTTLKGVEVAAMGLTGVIGALAGVFLAWEVGFQIGTFLNKFDIVQKAGTALASGLTKSWLNAKKAWYWLFGTDADVAKVERELNEADQIYAEMFANVGREAKNAAATQIAEQKKVTAGAEESAKKQQNSQKKATDEMKSAYKSYADTVKKLQDDIAGRERSLAEQLREMGRSGMSDLSAWKDRKKEAAEFAAAARKAEEAAKAAFKAGDNETGSKKYEEAVALYDKARAAAADLNKEIRDGDKVIQSQQQSLNVAKGLVEQYGKAGIETQKDFEQAITDAAEALNAQSGGSLAKELPEVARQFGTITEQAEDLAGKSEKFNKQWNAAWDDFLKDGKGSIHDLDKKLTELTKDRHINVYVSEVQKRMHGGLIGSVQRMMQGGSVGLKMATGGAVAGVRNMLAGGHFPGFGGGDRRHVVAEDGEYMLDKFRVRDARLDVVQAFHAGDYGYVVQELMKRMHGSISRQVGGIINRIPSLPAMPQYMQAGGSVVGESPSGGGVIRHEHTLRTADGRKATVYTDDLNADRLIGILRMAEVMGS